MSINNAGALTTVPLLDDTNTAAKSSRGPQDLSPGTSTSENSTQWSELRNQTAGIRDQAQSLGSDAEELHHRVQNYDLTARASLKARSSPIALLTELTETRGLGWAEIATAVGVSLSAVRKWRNGGTCTPSNRTLLARLGALLDLIEEACIDDPASWLLTEVWHGYTLRFIDLVAGGREDLVLDCVFRRKSEVEILDVFRADWRDTTSRLHETHQGGDGAPFLSRRA